MRPADGDPALRRKRFRELRTGEARTQSVRRGDDLRRGRARSVRRDRRSLRKGSSMRRRRSRRVPWRSRIAGALCRASYPRDLQRCRRTQPARLSVRAVADTGVRSAQPSRSLRRNEPRLLRWRPAFDRLPDARLRGLLHRGRRRPVPHVRSRAEQRRGSVSSHAVATNAAARQGPQRRRCPAGSVAGSPCSSTARKSRWQRLGVVVRPSVRGERIDTAGKATCQWERVAPATPLSDRKLAGPAIP